MGPRFSLLLLLSGCSVDGSVIDDLPCECAGGFVCAIDRRVRAVGRDGDAIDAPGSDDFNALT
ncbi:MAG: hypothetical protein AAF645_01700 [Myxococcota bacterium]